MPLQIHDIVRNDHENINASIPFSDRYNYKKPPVNIGIVTDTDAVNGFLSVWVYQPTISATGDLWWNNQMPLELPSGARTKKVYPYNLNNQTDEIKCYFPIGEVIEFFNYDGIGDNIDKIRGACITRAKPYFWAQLNEPNYPPTQGYAIGDPNGLARWRYNWQGVYWNGDIWNNSETFSGQLAKNMSEINNAIGGTLGTTGTGIGVDVGGFFHNSNAQIQPVGNGYVQMFRFWNKFNTPQSWDYYFNNTPNSGQCPNGPGM
jgi:hypothetical protein